MRRRSFLTRAVTLGISGVILFASRPKPPRSEWSAPAASLPRIKALAPEFERATGNTGDELGAVDGGNAGSGAGASARGEPIDVVIMVGYALGDLVRQGKVDGDSRVDLARSGIGIVVQAGAPQTGHQLRGCAEADALASEVDRLFG